MASKFQNPFILLLLCLVCETQEFQIETNVNQGGTNERATQIIFSVFRHDDAKGNIFEFVECQIICFLSHLYLKG